MDASHLSVRSPAPSFIEKAYTLLVFAGIWALLHGVGDLIKTFQIRKLRELVR